MTEIILESLIDSLKLLPFLFLSYIIIEFIEHKSSQKINKALANSNKYNTVIGGLLGLFPQCGFSAIASNLFAGKIISIGTLIAVFISTSDEAIPMLIGSPDKSKDLIIILVIKLFIAIIFGSLIDFIYNKFKSKTDIKKDLKEHIHSDVCSNCDCEDHGILKPAIKHTIEVFLFILIITFGINICVELIGTEMFENIILTGNIFQPFVACIIGLIPNCVASVLLTKLYIEGALSLGSIIAGLTTSAGIGAIVLFRVNKNLNQNLKIIGMLYAIGVFSGIIINLIGFMI